jgi:adenylyl-sulfate kinase
MQNDSNIGAVAWLTGLSGSGKSTIARAAAVELSRKGISAEILDGDAMRATISRDLGFSKADRDENVRRAGYMAAMLARNGIVVMVALISPYRAARDEVRAQIEKDGIPFLEVFVNAPLSICESRDPKGLYGKARRGEIPAFTGIEDPYEPPFCPDVECRTDRETIEFSTWSVLSAVERSRAARFRSFIAHK